MKKIYSFVFAAIAILSAASCQKEIINAPEVDTDAVPFSFVAERDAETKTVLVDGKSIYWTPGDAVSAFDADGKAQTFIGYAGPGVALETNSPQALFYNPSFKIPADGSIHTVYPVKADATIDESGVIGILRVAGTQKAVAGSFDPTSAVAYGVAAFDPENPTTPPTLAYTNIHSLVKFTIGGEKAPSKVIFTNGGMRNIAGQFKYNTKANEGTTPIVQDPDMGAKAVTLTPAEGESFEVGETYYIAVIGGGNFANVSLTFDETVVKTVEGAKYADGTNNFFLNKIIDLGTVKFPDREPEIANFTASLVMAKQSGATSYMAEFGGTANTDRNMGMDAEYVYIAETKASPVLWKIAVADGTASDMPVGTVDGGGTFALACPRVIKNTDAGINGGNDVLAVCNMGQGTAVYLYLYANGIDNDPVKINLHFDGLNRRLGDQFSVSGSLQSGYVWFKEQGSNAVMLNQLAINSENIGRYAAEGIWPDRVMLGNNDTERGSLYFYPGADWSQALYTSTATAALTVRDDNTLTSNKPTYVEQSLENADKFAGCHGFNFFKLGGRDYIAYTKFSTQTVYVINGAADANGVKAALEANEVVWSAKIAGAENACYSNNSGADCAVSVIDDSTVRVSGHIQNVGVVVYELTLN